MRYYIWLNIAAAKNHYWSRPAQNFTTDHTAASVFETLADAEMELSYAARADKGEVFIRGTTDAARNI